MKQQPIPLNAIMAQVDEDPQWPEQPSDKRYLVLFEEDYHEHGVDMAGNVALLLDKENAEEVKELAEEILEHLDDD